MRSLVLSDHLGQLETWIEQGGPRVEEYGAFGGWLREGARRLSVGEVSRAELAAPWEQLGAEYLRETMQGAALLKPLGYAGDYTIIDAIYERRVTQVPHLRRWDLYYHSQIAPQAVRNRKKYFQELLVRALENGTQRPIRVLNLGSGPGRDVLEALEHLPQPDLRIDCVDLDPGAIQYATQLCERHSARVSFTRSNVFRFYPTHRYDIIWSAGLFDYLDDRRFRFLVTRFKEFLKPRGRMIIGNFGPRHPTQDYMEIVGQWFLNYRDPAKLESLAQSAGCSSTGTTIESEATGTNLFLHMSA